jgi:hypothetical protein
MNTRLWPLPLLNIPGRLRDPKFRAGFIANYRSCHENVVHPTREWA